MPDSAVDPRYHDPLLGVIFDLDGTLIISHHQFQRMREAIVALAGRYGVASGTLSLDTPIPRLMTDALEALVRTNAPETKGFRFEAEATAQLDAIEMEALPGTVVRPGAPELLERLGARGYRLGLLTRSSGPFAAEALRRTGLDGRFGRIRTRSDSGPAKPDPEALLLLLNALEVPRERAVFVGDHLLDAECAQRAGVRFYAVLPVDPNPLGTEVERFRAAGATAIAPDLETLGRQLGVAPSPAMPA